MPDPTPRTLTFTLPDVIGGTAYAQLTATLALPGGPAVLPGTPLGPIRTAPISLSGTASLPLYANDDADATPTGTAWTIWADLQTASGRAALAPLTVQLFVADPSSVDLASRSPATATPLYSYIPLAQKGAANGVAPLGSDGLVPAQYLPPASGGSGGTTTTDLRDWAAAEAWTVAGATYSTTYPGLVATATVIWPDGSGGTFAATAYDPTWQAIKSYTLTHTTSGRTVTQAAITRDSSGRVTAQPALTVS